mmetsp:Transcript_7454/g.8663  ORF Transcript_7454/g.8663 Transcript_7454/m.8663 type:complete len:700 (-) Transcript_7454:292-2391(-)
MRRGSRKKQQDPSFRGGEELQQRPVAAVPTKRQQPPQEVLQQQRKKHQDEVSSLTTKNYRLAKELADLRLRHRDECKNVSRVTMENMSLASRCREAISHVAMLKKELAMQQKRTVQALASQREQTQRMADSLTNSFISNSSSPDVDCNSKLISTSRRVSDESSDDNVLRLVSNTPSPDRTSLPLRENIDENESQSSKSVTGTNTTSATFTRASSPTEEYRDSPATTVTSSPKVELELFSTLNEDDTVVDSIKLSASSLSESNPGDELVNVKATEEIKQAPVVYSTPKRSEDRRSTSPKFHVESDSDYDDAVDQTESATGMGLFPFSASPKTFIKPHSNRGNKSYDEQFPSDVIDQPENGGIVGSHGKDSQHKQKMTLMNSIDAFEKSFSTDFPDSFAPKESTNSNASGGGSQHSIYHPFFATPKKSKENHDSTLLDSNDDGSPMGRLKIGGDQYVYSTPTEEKNKDEPFDIEHVTPPKNRNENNLLRGAPNKNNREEPGRPEKIIPSTARARYEQALGPREGSLNCNQNEIESSQKSQSRDQVSRSETNSPSALFRRIQQKRRMSKKHNSVEEVFYDSTSSQKVVEVPATDSSSFKEGSRKSITSIVDAFEQNRPTSPGLNYTNADTMNGDGDKSEIQQNSKLSSRFEPRKSLRHRNVKPISYAEPSLNTKLRRGDTFFPKTNDQVIQPTVISPEPTVV